VKRRNFGTNLIQANKKAAWPFNLKKTSGSTPKRKKERKRKKQEHKEASIGF
jgi:hypothetical protein